MSRGAGKWQTLLLDALDRHQAFYAADLLSPGYTRAQYVALLRALNVLERSGVAAVDRYTAWAASGRRVVVRRPGRAVHRDDVRRLR